MPLPVVIIFTIGGSTGYEDGKYTSNTKQPRLYGVSTVPVISARTKSIRFSSCMDNKTKSANQHTHPDNTHTVLLTIGNLYYLLRIYWKWGKAFFVCNKCRIITSEHRADNLYDNPEYTTASLQAFWLPEQGTHKTCEDYVVQWTRSPLSVGWITLFTGLITLQ